MVKMKEFTPTGGEESVRFMAGNNDGGHECAVVKDGESGNLVRMENGSNVIDDDDADNCFMRYEEEKWKECCKESAHLCENKEEFEFIMDLERMEMRQLEVILEMFYERRRHRRRQQQQQQQQQQQESFGNGDKLDDTMSTAITMDMNESFDSISTTIDEAVDDDEYDNGEKEDEIRSYDTADDDKEDESKFERMTTPLEEENRNSHKDMMKRLYEMMNTIVEQRQQQQQQQQKQQHEKRDEPTAGNNES